MDYENKLLILFAYFVVQLCKGVRDEKKQYIGSDVDDDIHGSWRMSARLGR